ncbi:MAG: NADH:flavin oxidoreductase [Actinobacteria bacterium RBG_16_68_21]|nr:MAG: NADH:flavin oxidoreductase [Actinobacteria bacterium RBG_16_68_21]
MSVPRLDPLLEAVPFGPLVARNRFWQVPHCNGMGYRDPSMLAAMRGVKAEGGWAVVSTEEVEIHPSSEITPSIEGRIWDEADIPAHRLVTDAIHRHGALAAIELVHSGMSTPNYWSRVPPMGPSHQPLRTFAPVQAREMTKADIADLRSWHRGAVRRSLQAEYDVVYVYAGHSLTTLQHFLSPRYNHRTDEYGGSLPNRVRLLREVLEETLEEVAGTAAVACRIAVDELYGDGGTTREHMEEILAIIGELPDVWDFMVGEWADDSVTSRFGPEGGQEEYVRGLKALTSKPVIGVGRFTSPETMRRMVRQGILDFIGAARPSIADPFLPAKIAAGREDDIRECIGCNICVAGDWTSSPIRCTQNPSMGEEWRRRWHPETIRPLRPPERVLVVGAGPAGLEAAMSAGRRGCEVVLVEARGELGGRVAAESRLPGLEAWRRVVDYRVGQIERLPTVAYYLASEMTADEALTHGFGHIAVATGAVWRRGGVGIHHRHPIPLDGSVAVFTPDDLMGGTLAKGRVVLFDDDHYYLGGVLAELLARAGAEVTLVTAEAEVSPWTRNTMEQHRVHRRLLEGGVDILAHSVVTATRAGEVVVEHVVTGGLDRRPADVLVLVTGRLPNDGLARDLPARTAEWPAAGLRSVRAIGDAFAPGAIVGAVWDGRRFAEELDGPDDAALFRRNPAAI